MQQFTAIILIAVAAASLTGASPLFAAAAEESNFAGVKVTQNETQITITITKSGPTAPTEPVIVIPPKTNVSTSEGNGTTLAPGESVNTTAPTEPGKGNVTVIGPSGNVTEIPRTNSSGTGITQIDNGSVIVVGGNRTITETPGNVTVIDPPVAPTPPAENQTCSCKHEVNATSPAAAGSPPTIPRLNSTTK